METNRRHWPLIVAAALGLAVAFTAGWAVGHQGVGRPERQLVAQTPTNSRPAATSSPSTTGPAGRTSPSTPVSTGDTGSAGVADTAPGQESWEQVPVPEFTCPEPTVRVSTAEQLQEALDGAQPGDSIRLADGPYTGEFRTTRDGSAAEPIYLCGGRGAIIEAGAIKGGYSLHFDGATYWRADGFTVRNGQKGVMVDAGRGIGLQNLLVEQIGDEAVHLRRHSTRNVVRDLTIRDTGRRKPQYGEGIYIGSAQSNWCEYTRCRPDHSDDNMVIGNQISQTTAEAVDIKEGTSGGVLSGNSFDGSAMTQGDSWVDVKGNDWLISGNTGVTAGADGYKVLEIADGWGLRNRFEANVSRVQGPGYAINVTKRHSDNVVLCDNTAQDAGSGLTTIDCTG